MPSDEVASANIKISNQTGGPFSADRGSNAERTMGNSVGDSGAARQSQSFTVGELLAFIPPAISAKTGLSLDQNVNVPVLENGTAEVKLSTLYQVCPNLFAAEITPLNDSVVPLPSREDVDSTQNVQAPEPSQNSPVSPFADAAASPMNPSFPDQNQQASPQNFTTPPAEFQNSNMPDTPSGDNPFWSQGDLSPQQEPDRAEPEQEPAFEKESFVPSFSSGETPKQSPAPTQNDDAPVSDSFSGQGTISPPMKGFAPPESNEMIGNLFPPTLGNALNQTEVDQSVIPEVEKENVVKEENVPLSNGAGEPEETAGFLEKGNPFLADPSSSQNSDVPNQFDSGPDFSTLFTKEAESDSEMAVPTEMDAPEKVSHPEPSNEITPSKESIFGAPSEKSYTPPPASNDLGDDDFSAFIPPTPEELAIPDIPALRETEELEKQEDPAVPEKESWDYESCPPAMEKSPEFVDSFSNFPPFETASLDDESPVTPVPDISFSGSPSNLEIPENFPGQALEEENHNVSLPTDPALSFGTVPPLRDNVVNDVELRAVFGTDESFTLKKIATLIVCLPGVSACAISTPKTSLQASKDKSATIGEDSVTLAKTVRKLADLTGSPDARSFAVNTEKGILSIFVGGESYLTVQHDPGGFEPGIQEKLILVAGTLDGITE